MIYFVGEIEIQFVNGTELSKMSGEDKLLTTVRVHTVRAYTEQDDVCLLIAFITIALFSALEQTHGARMWFYMSDCCFL